MADFVQGATLSSGGMLSGTPVQWTTAAVTQQTPVRPVVAVDSEVASGDPAASDLLQQAMNEVSFDTGDGVSYMQHSGEVVYVQDGGKLLSLGDVIASGDMAVMSAAVTSGVVVCGDQPGPVPMDVGGVLYKTENASALFVPSDPGAITVSSSTKVANNSSVESAYPAGDFCTSQAACPIEINSMRSLSSSQTSSDTVPPGDQKTDSAPLGSSRNPIRIVQKGNQYTAMQHLTPDQLSQIVQVIQEQQHLSQSKNASSSGGSAVLFNPDGGSQVVYRITTSPDSTEEKGSGDGKAVHLVTDTDQGHQKRIIRKRKKEDIRMLGSEWSRQEKEERKKHRPRTRSGRVSKPPQYMVKDYKHIHPVDYDEDYDDSDGGYSDFKHSGDEAHGEDLHSKDDSLLDSGHSHRSTVYCEISLCMWYIDASKLHLPGVIE